MGNRSTLAPPPTRASSLRDYRTLTLPAISPPEDDSAARERRHDLRRDAQDDQLDVLPHAMFDDEWMRPARPAEASRRAAAREVYEKPRAHGSGGATRATRRVPSARPGAVPGGVPARRPSGLERARSRSLSAARSTVSVRGKSVPIWLLANMAILVAAGLGVMVPRLLMADAASACQWHKVVPGDTLGNLGWTYHSSALALARANHISNPDLIYVGQVLCIPMSSTAQASSAPAVPSGSTTHVGSGVSGAAANNEQSFVQLALPYAVSAHQQCSWPVSLVLAQWGVEQGWHVPSYTGYNWGNVSAITGEPSVKGLPVAGSPTAFAYAKTPADGARYYVIYCKMGYYTGVAPAAASGGPNAAAVALGRSPWDAGHYTNIGQPGSSLLNAMRVFDLYWYDDPAHQGQTPPASQPTPAKPASTPAATPAATPAKPAPAPQAPAQQAAPQPPAAPAVKGVGLAPEPCSTQIPSSVWSVNYRYAWTVPPGCYGGVYTVNPANYVYRGGYGWCNWWAEVLRPDEPTLPWGSNLQRGSTPRVGATVFFAPFNQGASAAGHYAHVEAISPDGQYLLISEMNDTWRGAGFAKVNYRYIRVEPGVSFIY
jgi:LysM repeat protein